ncbi:DDE superfamily endonuclease [Pyrenophora tritici-repentis]|nr:DDE superfamily endonuclease [Pyrenophora tritici-repentis]
MPPHSSHLLQPLDVVPYSLLKRHYGDGISLLARSRIHHINKETFLPAFKAAFEKTFTPENVRAGFRGAGLVPYDPDAVLSKLDVQLRTPTPPAPGTIAWEAQTPRNARETEAQSTLIRNRMQNYRGSPASSLDEQVKQLSKGAQQIAHNMVLVQEEMGRLRDAVDTLTKRKTRKRRYVRTEEVLTVSEVSDLIAEREGGGCEEGEEPAKRVRVGRRCGRCGEIGHNSRTCKAEIEDADNSDASEQSYSIAYSIAIYCGVA